MIADERAANTVLSMELKAAKFTAQGIAAALRTLLESPERVRHGEQSLKTLNLQNRELSSMDVAGSDVKQLGRMLKKYAVDFAVEHDKGSGTYTLYFKAQDRDRLNRGLKECLKDYDRAVRDKKPVKETVEEAQKEAAARSMQKEHREKTQERQEAAR